MAENHKPKGGDNWIPETRSRLAQRGAKKPDTKAGQIWALWPEIKAALENGQSVKTIRAWLEEDAGIAVSITSLTSYISRSRRRDAANREAERGSVAVDIGDASIATELIAPSALPRLPLPPAPSLEPNEPRTSPGDPMNQAMQALTKPRFDIKKIHGDGDPTNKNLI